MSTLFTINKGPAQARCLASCVPLMREGDAMVLYEDGVYWAVPTGADSIVREAARQHNVYVVNADLTARGLSESALLAGLSGIDYREFVRLVTRHTHCQSWF